MKRIFIAISISIFLSCERTEFKKSYYENGALKFEVAYKNGLMDGDHKEFYENGVIKTLTKYKEGVLSDTIRGYYENGNLNFIQFKVNGVDSIYTYDIKEGFIQSKAMVKNKQINGWRYYYNKKKEIISKIEFINLDHEEPYVNQGVFYDNTGRIIDSLSSYYKIEIPDTLIIDNIYPITISYNPSISKNSDVYFIYSHKIEKGFKNINDVTLDTLLLTSLKLNIDISYSTPGLKNLRGFFYEKNMEIMRNEENDKFMNIKTRSNKMYFDVPIYVEEIINNIN